MGTDSIFRKLHLTSIVFGSLTTFLILPDGYRTVAIDQPFDHTTETKKSSDLFPAPVPLDEFRDKFKNKLKILNRITITYSDSVVNHAMVRVRVITMTVECFYSLHYEHRFRTIHKT